MTFPPEITNIRLGGMSVKKDAAKTRLELAARASDVIDRQPRAQLGLHPAIAEAPL